MMRRQDSISKTAGANLNFDHNPARNEETRIETTQLLNEKLQSTNANEEEI